MLLMRDHSSGLKAMQEGPDAVMRVCEALERWEAKIVMGYRLLGECDQCFVIEAPDNFKAYRATLAQEMSTTSDTEILPAIDLPLFQRLISQSAQTDGPVTVASRCSSPMNPLARRSSGCVPRAA